MNKVETRVEALWNVAHTPSLSDAQRRLVLTRLRKRIGADGVLRVAADEHRSQRRNREAAAERLQELVRRTLKPPKPRTPTRPPRAAKERRLQAKRERSDKKRRRGPVQPDE